MRSFYDKDDYTIEDIQSLIDTQAEETIYLDFKSAGSLEKSDKKRIELSKDVASFANSDGGIIVYGIKEVNHVATEFTFIDGNEFTKEWIEQVINSYVQRRIPDVKIYPIRFDGDIKKSIYIVKIPYSYDAPHLSKDHRYYKRFNFMSVPMEEYEVRQSYERRTNSKLIIDNWGSKIEIKNDNVIVTLEASVYNDGRASELNYKTNIYLWPFNSLLTIGWPNTITNNDFTRLEDKKVKISAVAVMPIYPEETVTTIRFQMTIRRENIDEALKDLNAEIRVLYAHGQDTMMSDMGKLIHSIKSELYKADRASNGDYYTDIFQ